MKCEHLLKRNSLVQFVRALELCKRSRALHLSASEQCWHVAPAEQAAEPLLTWEAGIRVQAAQFITEYFMVQAQVIIIFFLYEMY